jgi:hypothetical protein
MNKEQVMGIVRHVLTFVGGAIVAKGLTTDAIMVELTGAAMTAIGAIWSIVSKIKSEQV